MVPLYIVQSGPRESMPWWPAEAGRRAVGSRTGTAHDHAIAFTVLPVMHLAPMPVVRQMRWCLWLAQAGHNTAHGWAAAVRGGEQRRDRGCAAAHGSRPKRPGVGAGEGRPAAL